MKILVAGKGFIGSEVGDRLEENHEVKYLDRSDADYEKDITEDFQIEGEFDVLVHTIGLAPGFYSEKEYSEVHVEGTENLVEAVETDKIIYISGLRAGEIDHSFFRTKKKAEAIIEQSNSDYTILRPSTVYGEGNKLLDMMRKTAFTRIFPDIQVNTQPIHREDLVSVVLESIEGYEDQVLDIAGPEKISIGAMAKNIYREEGYNCFLVPYPQFLMEWQLIGLSFLPPPFQRENIQILRHDNTTDENAAEEMVELQKIF